MKVLSLYVQVVYLACGMKFSRTSVDDYIEDLFRHEWNISIIGELEMSAIGNIMPYMKGCERHFKQAITVMGLETMKLERGGTVMCMEAQDGLRKVLEVYFLPLQSSSNKNNLLQGGQSNQKLKSEFSEDEEDLICRMYKLVGERWSLIAGRIPGRTAEEIEKY
ncbi:hypothetical protein HPP92_012399 [Vanilla planifolia]|uniref:Uncharacterized protein n=1 Tax=Vanilla planifolia TaxID=51239 RepID=A0A835V3B0_VANPL|nr:hypothetical protein HPP92_012399 [Vanilla planifolia]